MLEIAWREGGIRGDTISGDSVSQEGNTISGQITFTEIQFGAGLPNMHYYLPEVIQLFLPSLSEDIDII